MHARSPDGHTCSLFPGHPLLNEQDGWVAWLDDSPKPPATRITLTYPVLNHAHRVAFVSTGEGKQDVMEKVLDHPEEGLPSSRVKVISPGRVYFFSDDAALGCVPLSLSLYFSRCVRSPADDEPSFLVRSKVKYERTSFDAAKL